MSRWTTWNGFIIDRVVDGDTVRGWRSRELSIADGMKMLLLDELWDEDGEVTIPGKALRLVNLDTPERGTPGYDKARNDLAKWLTVHAGNLMVDTAPGGGFDRLLADIYVSGDRGNTASQHMLKIGWEPYVDTRKKVQ